MNIDDVLRNHPSRQPWTLKTGTHMKSALVTLLIALLSSTGTSSTASAAGSSPHLSTVVVSTRTYASEDAHAAELLDWIATVSPDHAPMGRGTVTTERMQLFADGLSNTLSSTPQPPGRLPERGIPGEEYKVENTLPDGTFQSWSYRWVQPRTGHGGGWSLTGYEYRKGEHFQTRPR